MVATQIFFCALLIPWSTIVVVSAAEFGDLPPRPSKGVRLYLGENDTVLPDYSMISASQFHDANLEGSSTNDGLWCQSANNGSTIGVWYLPNGTQVPTEDIDGGNDFPLQAYHATGQVGLLRDLTIQNYQGLYHCIIADENGINQTLVVAAYRVTEFNSAVDPIIDGNIQFEVHSSRDVDPPHFSLSFNVTERPPTNISCTLNSIELAITMSNITRLTLAAEDPNIAVQVSINLRLRLGGVYQCIVSNVGVHNDINVNPGITNNINLTVTGAPTNLSSTRLNLTSVLLTWSAPDSTDPPVQGYEIFYDNGVRLSQVVGYNTHEIILTSLQPDVNYTVFVVAFGGNLPSAHSNVITISANVTLSLRSNGGDLIIVGTPNLIITCEVSVDIPGINFTLRWNDPDFNIIMDASIYSYTVNSISTQISNFTISQVTLSRAGEYVCTAMFQEFANINKSYILRMQIPDPDVRITITPGYDLGVIYETSYVLFECLISSILSQIETETTLNVTWTGSYGVIQSNDTYHINTIMLNDTNYLSILNITSVNVAVHNNTLYTCSVVLMANVSFTRSSFITSGKANAISDSLIVQKLPTLTVAIATDGVPLIGKLFSITCTASIDDQLKHELNIQWLYNGSSILQENTTLTNSSVTVVFNPAHISHIGVYTCSAVLTIPGISDTVSDSLNYSVVLFGSPVITIITDGSNFADNSYSITCIARVPTGQPTVSWTYANGSMVQNESSVTLKLKQGIDNTMLTLQFDPLSYQHAGMYRCEANVAEESFNGSANESFPVYVRVPIPSISISSDSLSSIPYQATLLTLNCTAHVNSELFNTTLNWAELDSANRRITQKKVLTEGLKLETDLIFNPLASNDTGNYTCTVTVTPIKSSFADDIIPYIIGISESDEYGVFVQDIPEPIILSSVTGDYNVGSNLSVLCTVDIIDNLVNVSVNASIVKVEENSRVTLVDNTLSDNITLHLLYAPLKVSHSGIYECQVMLVQSSINYEAVYKSMFNVNITIPPPDIIMSIDPPDAGVLIEGTYIDLVCIPLIGGVSDVSIDVTITWFRNESVLTNSTEYTITKTSEQYGSFLRIEELQFNRDNLANYICKVKISDSLYIIGNENSSNITLSVKDFTSSDVTTSIIYSNPPIAGDLFIMTCNISVPMRLAHGPSSVIWVPETMHELGGVLGNITRNGSIFLHSLTFDQLTTDDAILYCCHVNFQDFSVSSSDTITLKIKIPPPTVSITSIPDLIYESTKLNLTCIVLKPDAVRVGVEVDIKWLSSNGTVIVNDNHITVTDVISLNADEVFQKSLIFNPVDNGDYSNYNDTGNYICQANIRSENPRVIENTNMSFFYVSVKDLPPLSLSISTTGSTDFGHVFSLICRANLHNLIPGLLLKWTKNNEPLDFHIIPVTERNESDFKLLTAKFTSLIYNMSGIYICTAEYNVSITNDAESKEIQYILNVTSFSGPQNFFVSEVSPFQLRLQWSPPSNPIGPFDYYHIHTAFSNGSSPLVNQIDANQTEYLLKGLSPYQFVIIEISAHYEAGNGSVAKLSQYTAQYDAGPVRNLSISTVNMSTVIVSWLPPEEANGIIEHYNISLRMYKGNELQKYNTSENQQIHIIKELETAIPYEIIISAVNGAGDGMSTTKVFFVMEGVPPAVTRLNASRLNGTHMRVEWGFISLTESRGFIKLYEVQYFKLNEGKQQTLSVVVPFNQTYVVINDLNPTSAYNVSVIANTSAGSGNVSNIVMVDRPMTSMFEVSGKDFLSCSDWTSSVNDSIKMLIRNTVVTTIRSNCSCSFEENYISGDILLCNDTSSTNVLYKANITAYGSISSEQLRQWVTNISCYTQYEENNGSICLQTISSSVLITNTDSSSVTSTSAVSTQINSASPSVTSSNTVSTQENFHLILTISITIPMLILLFVLVSICVVVLSVLLRISANKKDRYKSGQVSLEMTMYASKNAYKDTFVISSTEISETDSVYEKIDVTVMDSIQTRALPPQPNSATVSLQAHNQSITSGRMLSVSIPPTHDAEEYEIPSPVRSSNQSSSSTLMSNEQSVHLLTPPSSTTSLISNSTSALDQVNNPTRTLLNSREQRVRSFDVGINEYPRESRKAGSSLSLPPCVKDIDGYAAITRDRRIQSATLRPSFPIAEVAQEYEAPFTSLNEDIAQREYDLPKRLKPSESGISQNSEGEETTIITNGCLRAQSTLEKPPQDYEVPICSVSSADDSVVSISTQNTQQFSQNEYKQPQEYEVPISSVSSIKDVFCNPPATQHSILDSTGEYVIPYHKEHTNVTSETQQENDPQDYEIPVPLASPTDYNSAFLPATQEEQSILESTGLGEYVKLSDDKIKDCANVDPDVCEVNLTQELEVLISVSDNESGGSQEPALDKLGYTYAVVNKKKKKTTSMKTDETTDCTVYYNVNVSPKTDNKRHHWYENVDIECKSGNETSPNKT